MNPQNLGAMAGILAILLTGIIILVPVFGLTLRFALRPAIEAWTKLRSESAAPQHTELLSRQISLLETELQQVQQTLQHLVEIQDFQRQLSSERPIEKLVKPGINR